MDIKELLERGVSQVYIKKELEAALKGKKKLRIYYGVDPSGPVIHLGHAVHLRKLRDFQKLGHKIIFLIGDFTGMIGDPTDRDAVRKPLTRKEVLANAKTYKRQVEGFLNFSGKNPAEIAFNSKWNDKLNFKDLIQLASNFTVQQLMERDMFQERLKNNKPISLHEFLYPVVQGYDAVQLDADMQIGGTDQTFNMLQGRELMRTLKNKMQMVMSLELLEGTDGRKMSKSFGNIIGVEDPANDMYGKVMSLKDELIVKYFELATEIPMKDVAKKEKDLKDGKNPRDIKAELAFEVVKIYHGEKKAKEAAQEFDKIFKNRETATDKQPLKYVKSHSYLDVLSKVLSSRSEVRRLVSQRGIKVNDKVLEDPFTEIQKGDVIQVGKRLWFEIK